MSVDPSRSMAQKYVGSDPDPTDYLYVSLETKKYDQSKPYDAKRSCWVPDDKEGFVLGEIKAAKGNTVTVQVGYKESNFKKDLVAQVNPPKFEKCEDMSDLTYLNDASVLHNLKSRYFAKLIYTYSGLFCVAINPYKRYPIYTERVVRLFEGKRRTEVPPHIFAISDNAYRDMLTNDQNQSILITGESGAGKTENTKKVIYYFSVVGSNAPVGDVKSDSQLETQIIRTNPILESFGNAKTVRNDNSSRFGKFIRIHFNIKGKIAGADIETYLLEKARVVSQQHNERSYHIFYQIMSGGISGVLDSLQLSKDLGDYPHQSMGTTVIEGVNDKEEMLLTDSSMDILGFSSTNKMDTYKIVATVMHLGNMKFKQRGREEQAEADGEESGKRVCSLLGLGPDELYDNLLRPKIKVGTEFVTQGRNKKQVCYSVSALCKAIFDRLFKWLVSKCNESMETSIKKNHFIGVLDIAGFEIFDFNSFEQLCINFTNEKLQQFFNHHMFVLEQEEYQREGITWTFIDFGLDLQACIDLIEKPLGIFSILEEESMFPKATNKSFEDKLINNHMGKTPNFIRPKQTGHGKGGASANHDPDEDPSPHFAIVHYAGTVPYNVNGWLEKNKDPLNECVVEQIKTAKNKLASELFKEHAGEHKQTKRARGSAFQTVSALYREQVQNLMQTLQATSPHFIRCIIPNEKKDPAKIDANLVMQQLTCNGVLEGIRICRKGFPNRMFYKDFKERYLILASKPMLAMGNDTKSATQICFDKIELEDEKYRLGSTKVFFRSGVLGYLEELRAAKVSKMISYLQAACRGYLGKLKIHEYMIRKKALPVVQRAIRNFMKIRPWLWYRLFKTIRPMLEMGVSEDIIQELKDKLEAQKLTMEKEEKRINEVEEELEKSALEKQRLAEEMEKQKKLLEDLQAKEDELMEAAKRNEQAIRDALKKAEEEEEAKYEADQAKKRAQMENRKLNEELEDIKQALAKSSQDREAKNQQLTALKDELERQTEQMSRLNKERKDLYNQNIETKEELESSEEKNRHLEKLKRKLESEMDELENSLQKEKESKDLLERARRKAEEELKKFMADLADQEEAQKGLMALNQKKEKEMVALHAKLEENESNCAKYQKMNRERAMRIDELEEELEAESRYRSQAEKHRRELQQEMDELRLRLDEAGDLGLTQSESNRRREADISSLRKNLEEAQIKQEAALAIARKKFDEAFRSQQEELENHRRHRSRFEKERMDLESRIKESEAEVERVRIERAHMERDWKRDRSNLVDLKAKLDEANRVAFDFEHIRNRLEKDNGDLMRRLEDADNQIGQLNTNRSSLINQLNDAKKLADIDMKERSNIMSKYKQMEREHDSMRTALDDEVQAKENLQNQMAQLNREIQSWRTKHENETRPRLDDLENTRMKLQLRLSEAQDTIEGLSARCTNLEKSKQRIEMELDDIQAQFDASNHRCLMLEKQAKSFDKAMEEWKMKIDELNVSLSDSEKQNRIFHTELSSVKQHNSKLREDYDERCLEVKRLGEEMKELLTQIGDGGRSFRELQTQKRQLTLERDELSSALQEAEEALFSEENKLLRSKAENAKLKADIEGQISEKEREAEESKKGLHNLIGTLQASLEAEQKAKIEAMRVKKRLMADIRELEAALDHANHNNNEMQLNVKRVNAQMAELMQLLEEEKLSKENAREKLFMIERKANATQNELEKCRTTLEQTERGLKQMESELKDKKGELHSEVIRCNSLMQMKRKLEAEILSLRADLSDCNICLKDSHTKCRQATTDALGLSDDLKYMSERVSNEENIRRGLEAQLKEMLIHMEEIESSSLRGGKRLVAKLEERIRALQRELDAEERARIDAIKEKRKSDRKIKDYEVLMEEKERNCQRFTEMVSPLQSKMKLLKQQVEDAEEIAALNLAKYKKAIGEAEDSEKRAYVAEQAITRLRTRSATPGGFFH